MTSRGEALARMDAAEPLVLAALERGPLTIEQLPGGALTHQVVQRLRGRGVVRDVGGGLLALAEQAHAPEHGADALGPALPTA